MNQTVNTPSKIRLNEYSSNSLYQVSYNITAARELYQKIIGEPVELFNKAVADITAMLADPKRQKYFSLALIWEFRDTLYDFPKFDMTIPEHYAIKQLLESAHTMINLIVDNFKF